MAVEPVNEPSSAIPGEDTKGASRAAAVITTSPPPTTTTTTTTTLQKKVTFRYSRDVLLSFAELDVCKKRPEGLDPVIWRDSPSPEIIDSGSGSGSTSAGIAGPGGGAGGGAGAGAGSAPGPGSGGAHWVAQRGNRRDRENDGRAPSEPVPEWRKDSWRSGQAGAGGSGILQGDPVPQAGPGIGGVRQRRGFEDDPGAGGGGGPPFPVSHPPSRIGPGGSGAGGWDKSHRGGGFERFGPGPGQRSGPGPGTGGGRWEHRPGPTGEGRGFARQPQQPRDPPMDLDDASGENIVLERRGFNQGVSLRPGWGAGEHPDGLLGVGGAGRGRGEFRFGGAGRGAPGDRYQPRPPPIKEPTSVYDQANDETFGSSDSNSTANAELERKRREEFEQMRELQHRQRLAADQQGLRNSDVKSERRKYEEQSLWDEDSGLGTDAAGAEREGKNSAGILGPNGAGGQGVSEGGSSQPVSTARPPRTAIPPGFEKKQANGPSTAIVQVASKTESMDTRPGLLDLVTEKENTSSNGKSDGGLTASEDNLKTSEVLESVQSTKKETLSVSSPASSETQKVDASPPSDSPSPASGTSGVTTAASAPGASKAVGPGSRPSSGSPFLDGMWNVGLLFDPLQSLLKEVKAGDLKSLENEELLAAFSRLRDQGDLLLPEEVEAGSKAKGMSDSVLDKLFQNVKTDRLQASGVLPADDDELPKDERWTGGGSRSKSGRWFKQPDREAVVSTQGSADSTTSPLQSTNASANLLSLLTKGRTDARMSPLASPSPSVPTPISPQSPSQPLSLLSLQSGAARVLPMPQGPSLEAIEQAMAAEAAVGNRPKDPKKAADLQLQVDLLLHQLERARQQSLQGNPSNVIRSQLQLEAQSAFSGRLADLLGIKHSEQQVGGNNWSGGKATNRSADVNGVESGNGKQAVRKQGVEEGQPLVLTCQDFEQSILAEAGGCGMRDMQAVRNAMPGLMEDVSRMVMLMSSSERRDIASQHLLALLHRQGSAQSMAQNSTLQSTADKVMQSWSASHFGPSGMAPPTPGSGMRVGFSPTGGTGAGTGGGGGGSLKSATSIVPISVLVNNAGERLPSSGAGPMGGQWPFSNGARPPLGAIGPNNRPLNNSTPRESTSGFGREGEMRGGVPWSLIPPQVDQGQFRQGNERGPALQGMGPKHVGIHQNLSSSGGPLYGSGGQQGCPGMNRLSNSVGSMGIERKVGLGGIDGPPPPHGMMDRPGELPGPGHCMKDVGPVNVAMFFDKHRKNPGLASGIGSPLGPMREGDRGGQPMDSSSLMKPLKSGVSLAMQSRGLLNPLGKSLGAGEMRGDDMMANMGRLSASGGSVPRMMGEPGGVNRQGHGMGMIGPGMGLSGMLGMPHGPPPAMGPGERGGNGMVMHPGGPMGSMKPPMPPAPPGGQGMLPILSPQQQQQLITSTLIRSQSPPPLLPIRSQHPQSMSQPGLGPSVHHQVVPHQQPMRPAQGNPMQPQQQHPMPFNRGEVLAPGPGFHPMEGMAPGSQVPFSHNGPGPFPFPPPHVMPGSQQVGFHHVGPPMSAHMGPGGPPPSMGGGMHQRGFLPPGAFMHDHNQLDVRGSSQQGQQGGMGGLYAPGGGPGHCGPPLPPQGTPFNHQFLQQQGVPLPPGQMHGQRPAGQMPPPGGFPPPGGPYFPMDVKNGEFGGFNNSTGNGNGGGSGGGGGGNTGLERWFGNDMLSHMNRQHLPAMPGGPMQQMVPLDEVERKMRLA